MKIFAAFFLLLCTSLFAQSPKHPFTFEDMMKLKRVDEPVPSPDGKCVVFSATDVDLEANTKISHLWIVPASGGESKRLSETPNHEERPRFSPDGKKLIWTSKATDPTQIWMCDFDTSAGALVGRPHQVTNISTGADGAIWSPNGMNIVFVSTVYPDCQDDACNKQRDDELKKSKVKAKIFTRLFYRHWNAYTEFKRSHLFVVSADANSSTDILSVGTAGVSPAESSSESVSPAASETPDKMSGGPTGKMPVLRKSEPRDLTPGDHDVPPFHLGGQDMYAISPGGQELAYTSNIDEVEATSTNNEIFIVPMAGGNRQSGSDPKKISTSPGSDATPLYSPDGKYITWRSQARAGFESDKQSLILYERQSGTSRNITEKAEPNPGSREPASHLHPFDRSVDSFTWDRTGSVIYFNAEDHGESRIFQIVPETAICACQRVSDLSGSDLIYSGSRLFCSKNTIAAPSEIRRIELPPMDGNTAEFGTNLQHPQIDFPITHMNDALLSQIDMQALESFTFKGANNEDVQGFMVKPPAFDPAKKYPLKFLIHGGPQGASGNSWTYRWNAELFAANGYVVVMINFHGSTGYGQKFTDSISGDWGSKPYVDLMKGLDYVEKTFPFIDKNREAALGASYGGYMANWLLGHTNRFKCIVSHDGMFNAESAYGTTEELWFPNWEFGGPPWKKRDVYRKWSPHEYAANFKTPTLVVHGQNDYRLDVSQGFDLFTTLQVLKVPSKMLYFPDEGHWVLKPQNSQLWYKTVNDWVDQWCK